MKKTAVLNEFSIEAIRDALQKLDDFPKLIVNGLTAFQLGEIEKIDPVLFDEIAKKIKDDRWFPEVGMWCAQKEKVSEANLIKNIIYSAGYFKEKFGKKYRVFHGDTVYCSYLAQIVYAAEFDACYIKDEKNILWLDSANNSRILVGGAFDTVDVNDIDDSFISENEFGSFEEEVTALYFTPIQAETVRGDIGTAELAEDEKLLIEAEIISVQNGEDRTAEIKKLWTEIFLGNSVKNEAEEIIGGRKADDDFIKFDSDEVALTEMKYAEDGSGEVIIRIRETAGKEKTLFVMCDKLKAGFRCEILPYELQSFRIDSEGFVTEIFIAE